MSTFRIDSAQKLQWKEGKGGILQAFITLGVAEKPLDYYEMRADGSGIEKIVEAIDGEQLNNTASLESAMGAPINLGHPQSKKHAMNAEGLLCGSAMQEIRTDDKSTLIAATFQDQRADRLIKQARDTTGLFPEISPGYTVERTDERGGIRWQFGRRYDHFALLMPNEGRGGQDVRVRLDALDAVGKQFVVDRITEGDTADQARNFYFVQPSSSQPKEKKKAMPTILVGKRAYNTDNATDLDALGNAVAKLSESEEAALKLADEAETTLASEKAKVTEASDRADAAEKDLETSKGRADALDTKVKELENTRIDSSAIAADRKESIETWALCLPTLRTDAADFAPDYALDPQAVKVLYLQKTKPELNLDGASKERVDAMWDVLKPTAQTRVDASDALATVVTLQQKESREDAAGDATKKARAKARAERIAGNGNKSTMGA